MNILRNAGMAFLLTVSLTQAAVAQQQQFQWKKAASGGYTYKYVTNDPTQSRFYTLKNGLTVILSPSKKEPRVQCYIAVKAGSKMDPATHTGLAHYLEHLLFKGTDKFGTLNWSKEKPLLDQIDGLYEQYNKTKDEAQRKEIYKQIDKVSGEAAKFAIASEYHKMVTAIGAKDINAFTSKDQTIYQGDVPGNAINKYLAIEAERFRNPILRLFHTELEAVYEEKNRGLDDDGRKVIEAMLSGIFTNHNYGKQTNIGTVEHLKNPSLLEIRKYYNTYYVPNNMGIIMSGDFNPDQVIRQIDQAFGYMQPKPVPAYTFEPEQPIAAPITVQVTGPDQDKIMLGFRFPGAATKEAQMLELVDEILTNGSTGLFDLNLVKKQKLLQVGTGANVFKDYSLLLLEGFPLEGQSLDDVKSLLLAELGKLKKGDFSDDLIPSIVNNEKKKIIERNESYSQRAEQLMQDFADDINQQNRATYINNLGKITKQDIMAFANKHLANNYVAVYKRQGEDKSIVKVDKPAITPVAVNREAQSDFLKKVNTMPENKIEPVWIDYQKDIQRAKAGPYEVLAVQNKDNELFRLYYRYETGSWSNKLLPVATEYLQFLGTKDKSSEDISKDFYQVASSFYISTDDDNTTVVINGLQEHMDKAIALFDNLLHNCQPDQEAFEAFKASLKKARANKKTDKEQIRHGLTSYARYGASNPFNNELSDAELDALKAEDLVNVLHNLASYPHRILYYGPQAAGTLAATIAKVHPAPAGGLKALPPAKKFQQLTQSNNKVLFTHYDMVQAEVVWTRNSSLYDTKMTPVVSLFNEYFDGDMGSILFQTIRESKALAYATQARYTLPNRKEYHNNTWAYVGTQSDKFNEAVTAMNELLNELPESDKAFQTAKTGLQKTLTTERITRADILFDYLEAERLGLDYDIRKSTYEALPKLTFADLKSFHARELSQKPYTYCIIANQDKLKEEDMKKLGEFKKLSLEEIFSY